LSRSNKKLESANVHSLNDREQQQQPLTRNPNLYPQSRQPSNGIRSVNNVSFISDVSKNGGKIIGSESNGSSSTHQLKTVDKSKYKIYLKFFIDLVNRPFKFGTK
jgi:hypothetical protein